MQVSNPNNIKIYNLSAGKSLPEWLTDRKKRSLQKSDVEIQKRIELLQDFEMPYCSSCIRVSPDGQYLCATGIYKPRIRCYDVSQLSMKFERCMDYEVIKFEILSEDYSKFVFLQNDRYVEFHSQHGGYYRTRIPKYGRDLAYHQPSCDMYFVGASPEIYRLNLEIGRFMKPIKTSSNEILCCQFNPVHDLFTCGTKEGHIECWDPRTRQKAGYLDCALNSLMRDAELEGLPSVTSVKYKDALTLAVGTATGQILLYDLRSNKPLLMKDHNYNLPIKCVEFHDSQNLVLSCDSRILKLWDRNTGKAFTSIEPENEINDLCLLPNTGMLFMASEAPKMQTFYIPALGPAPKWCSFLDSLTEELEENPMPTVYDDYKFVTRTELDGLGLTHLIGTNLLRAYMHGYFMDIRLYRKAKSIAEPFAYEDYRKNKIREKIEEERENRVKLQKLPKVNRQLAEKLLDQDQVEENPKKKKSKNPMPNLMEDTRFSTMFSNPDFQVDMESEEYRLLNPLVSKLDKARMRKREKQLEAIEQDDNADEEPDGRPSDEENSSDESSDDEHTWKQEVKEQHRLLQREQKARRRFEEQSVSLAPKVYEMKADVRLKRASEKQKVDKKQKLLEKQSLAERVATETDHGILRHTGSSVGNMEMTFSLKKPNAAEKKHRQASAEHHKERKKIRRSAGSLVKDKDKPKFWMGKRVK